MDLKDFRLPKTAEFVQYTWYDTEYKEGQMPKKVSKAESFHICVGCKKLFDEHAMYYGSHRQMTDKCRMCGHEEYVRNLSKSAL